MFDNKSRYFLIETAKMKGPDGRTIVYKLRRFLPDGEILPLLAEVMVSQNDRLDTLSANTIGDPEQFWRICDANNTMNPFDLVQEIGRKLRVPIPQPEE